MSKSTRSADRLRAMVQVRLLASSEVQERLARDQNFMPTVGNVIAHERDLQGRNWTILHLENGEGLGLVFRSIVDRLRNEFDLD